MVSSGGPIEFYDGNLYYFMHEMNEVRFKQMKGWYSNLLPCKDKK
jgi:hypothetical protein